MALSKKQRAEAQAKHIANCIATGQLTIQDRVVHLRTKWFTFKRIWEECWISEAHAHRLWRHIPKMHVFHTRTELVNLLPHDVFYRQINTEWRIEKTIFHSSWCLRWELKRTETGDICWMPTYAESHKPFQWISCARVQWRSYIVSRYTAAAYPNREDFYVIHHKPDDMRHPVLGRKEENEIDWLLHNPYHKEYMLRYSKDALQNNK